MKVTILFAFITSLLPLASCHFQLVSPKVRGFEESKLDNFPCGAQDKVGTRTPFPLNGGNIQLEMGHDESRVQVLLGLGENPGQNFNITLVPTLQERGLGSFCLGSLVIPSSLGIRDGQNATIQVVTNGDPRGGLYNCADITFQTSAEKGTCQNGTGVVTSAWTGTVNANGTGPNVGSSSTSSSSSAAGAASATATRPSMAVETRAMEVWIWALMGIVGGAVALW